MVVQTKKDGIDVIMNRDTFRVLDRNVWDKELMKNGTINNLQSS